MILRFCYLLERHQSAGQILAVVNDLISGWCLVIKAGTVVDAVLIAAPSSTKRKDHQRNAERHQIKKGSQWFFGMKA